MRHSICASYLSLGNHLLKNAEQLEVATTRSFIKGTNPTIDASLSAGVRNR
ncbi:hypothetical protein [Nostoc sp. C117]|uniref:hypothetical protein n=1 Tax=Nostoc sp. C117 TaxID=3349875 RepID=UPI00370D732D